MAALSQGLAVGWLSPAILILQSPNKSPLTSGPITVEQISWLGSCLYAGGLFGFVLLLIVNRYFGLKMTHFFGAIPGFVSVMMMKKKHHLLQMFKCLFVCLLVINTALLDNINIL